MSYSAWFARPPPCDSSAISHWIDVVQHEVERNVGHQVREGLRDLPWLGATFRDQPLQIRLRDLAISVNLATHRKGVVIVNRHENLYDLM
jgi:hypothetical protein